MAMRGTMDNPIERGLVKVDNDYDASLRRYRIPRGWLVSVTKSEGSLAYVPFSADGTGWGPNDPVSLVQYVKTGAGYDYVAVDGL